MLSRHSLSRPLSFSLCNWIISSQVLLDCIFHINRIFTFDLEWTIIGLYLSHQVSFYFSSSPFQIIIFGVLLNYILRDVKNLMFFITSLHTHGWVPSQIVSLWTQFPRLKDQQSDYYFCTIWQANSQDQALSYNINYNKIT